jgi:manganese transport protein
MLWIQAEVVAMATDLAEFTGAAVGINLIFGVPLLPAGLITAVVAFVILGLEQHGYRRFELAIIALLALVGLGFAYLFIAAGGQDYGQLAAGLLPRLADGDTLGLTVGIVGATVMPHVIYLHSALQANRVQAASHQERRALLAGNEWDCIVGLGLASSSVGTYAGQVVMAGFMNSRIPLLARRALTMLPSLILLAFAVNTTRALVYSQIILSFGIPFALIPLLLITRDPTAMTDMPNRRVTTTLMLLTTVIITGLNLYLLYDATTGIL